MTPVKISIVIPTRNRGITLDATVNSCLDSNSDRFEVLVCNNCSDDDTLAVLAGIDDRRVRVVSTPERYSMCDNWEYAIDQSCGDFIIVIGDDDAVTPGSMDYLLELVDRMTSDVYYWNANIYSWPLSDKPARVLKTWPSEDCETVVELAPKVDRSLRLGGLYYMDQPLLYHTLVRRTVLGKVSKQTGRLFHGMLPDVFMAYALPVFVTSMVFSNRVITCYGNSSVIRQENIKEYVETKFKLFQGEYGDYSISPRLPVGLPPQALFMQDSILTVMDLFPDYYGGKDFGYEVAYATAIRDYEFISTFRFILMTKELKSVHPFSPVKFLFFSGLHRLASIRRFFRKKISRKKFSEIGEIPSNILDFVRSEKIPRKYFKSL